MRWNCLPISPSRPGVMRSRNSTTSHLAAEPAPHRAQFEPDIAAADHQQALRHRFQRERAGRGHDLLLVDRHAGQRHDVGARGDDDVLRLERTDTAVLRLDLDLAGGGDPALADDGFGLVFLSRNSTPLVSSPTTLSLCAIMAGRSRLTWALMPSLAKSLAASSNSSLVCSSALEGMQPIFRQVPPKARRACRHRPS